MQNAKNFVIEKVTTHTHRKLLLKFLNNITNKDNIIS